jgi:SAM-dependent methyltransferase
MFDVVVCQFGVMFFPNKPKAYREVFRVLKPGGLFLFSGWDRIETNDLTHIVHQTLTEMFPDDPPMFMARTPMGLPRHRHNPGRRRRRRLHGKLCRDPEAALPHAFGAAPGARAHPRIAAGSRSRRARPLGARQSC